MSLGGDPLNRPEHFIDKFYEKAEMDRLAKAAKAAKAAAGHKSLWRRLRERALPNRQQPGGDA